MSRGVNSGLKSGAKAGDGSERKYIESRANVSKYSLSGA